SQRSPAAGRGPANRRSASSARTPGLPLLAPAVMTTPIPSCLSRLRRRHPRVDGPAAIGVDAGRIAGRAAEAAVLAARLAALALHQLLALGRAWRVRRDVRSYRLLGHMRSSFWMPRYTSG